MEAPQDMNIACLVDAVFHEARGQSVAGRFLVYRSILNRAKDRRWKADTACKVVYQPLQYSFTLLSDTELKRRVNSDTKTYNTIKTEITTWFNGGEIEPEDFKGVNHYLRCDWRGKVTWDDDMAFLGKVGDHCFYEGR